MKCWKQNKLPYSVIHLDGLYHFDLQQWILPYHTSFVSIPLRFWSSRKYLGLIDLCHFFTRENFDNKHEFLLVRILELTWKNMKEILLDNLVSNAKESTTFSMNKGPDF